MKWLISLSAKEVENCVPNKKRHTVSIFQPLALFRRFGALLNRFSLFAVVSPGSTRTAALADPLAARTLVELLADDFVPTPKCRPQRPY